MSEVSEMSEGLSAWLWLLGLETSVSPNPGTGQGHKSESRADHLGVNQGPVGQVKGLRIHEQVPDGQRCNINTPGIHECACACDRRVAGVHVCVGVGVCVCVHRHSH